MSDEPLDDEQEFREIAKASWLLEEALDEWAAAWPAWRTGKSLDALVVRAGHASLAVCPCRYYRDDRTRSTRCECGHQVDEHEENRRCWFTGTGSREDSGPELT